MNGNSVNPVCKMIISSNEYACDEVQVVLLDIH